MVARTMVGYPDEPSRKALIVAGLLLTGAGAYVVKKNRDPILRAGVSLMAPVLARPLALWLTRMGLI